MKDYSKIIAILKEMNKEELEKVLFFLEILKANGKEKRAVIAMLEELKI